MRLLEGFVAAQIVNARAGDGKPAPLPQDKKAEVFRRAITDLAKVPKPAPVALEKEVRDYLSARCRLASLLFAQGRRADPEPRRRSQPRLQPRRLVIAEDVIALVPTFDRDGEGHGRL